MTSEEPNVVVTFSDDGSDDIDDILFPYRPEPDRYFPCNEKAINRMKLAFEIAPSGDPMLMYLGCSAEAKELMGMEELDDRKFFYEVIGLVAESKFRSTMGLSKKNAQLIACHFDRMLNIRFGEMNGGFLWVEKNH